MTIVLSQKRPQAAAGLRAGRTSSSRYSFETLMGRAVETAVLGRPLLMGAGSGWYKSVELVVNTSVNTEKRE